MAEFLRYRMRPQDDLSVRTDFTSDVMTAAKKHIQSILDESEEVQNLRTRAAVDVRLVGTLRSVSFEVNITPAAGVEMSKEELEEQREAIGLMVKEAFGDRLSDVLQEGIDSARRRM
jgi:hypothetical protein